VEINPASMNAAGGINVPDRKLHTIDHLGVWICEKTSQGDGHSDRDRFVCEGVLGCGTAQNQPYKRGHKKRATQ
jgi:hypothetical protein